MMPDDRGRAECNDATRLLKTPTKINIVASFPVFGIETADVFKRPAIKRHVTTGNVLRHSVGKQNMAWASRRGGNASLN